MTDQSKIKEEATAEILHRFNEAFLQHDPSLLDELIAEECVLENTTPAPNGSRHVGRAACLELWTGIAADAVAKATGYAGRIAFDASKPDGAPRKLMDSGRLNAMGWRASVRLEEGLVRAYRDFLNHAANET